jgi:putative cardiolipin synthase
MHNKLVVVDGRATIAGGRNIGGHYFEADEEANFTDTDVLLLGPIATDAQSCFQSYWTSELSVPLHIALGKRNLKGLRNRLQRYEQAARTMRMEELYRNAHAALHETLRRNRLDLHWASARIIADDPRKASEHRARNVPQVMIDALKETWASARGEVLAAMAYFVPGRRGTRDFVAMTRRGVNVRVLTNSLASNDVPAVHAGYTRYRRVLLRAGVTLFEYQRFGKRPEHHFFGKRRHRHGRASRSTALHSKTIVIDRRLAWIGSFNLDPRSARLNTEMAVLLESESLAADLARRMELDMTPDRSWRVMIIPGTRQVRWGGHRDGKPVTWEHEPDTGWLLRSWARLASHIPAIERFL